MRALTQRWLPMPIHSAVLFLSWLLLNDSLAPGNLLMALFFAITIPLITTGLQSPQPRAGRPLRIIGYFAVLLWDIVIANFSVARLILARNRKLRPGFLRVPLDIEGDLPITLLASTISLTPGTVSAEVSVDRKYLYVHALNIADEAQMIAEIKNRYENPLREIFGC